MEPGTRAVERVGRRVRCRENLQTYLINLHLGLQCCTFESPTTRPLGRSLCIVRRSEIVTSFLLHFIHFSTACAAAVYKDLPLASVACFFSWTTILSTTTLRDTATTYSSSLDFELDDFFSPVSDSSGSGVVPQIRCHRVLVEHPLGLEGPASEWPWRSSCSELSANPSGVSLLNSC